MKKELTELAQFHIEKVRYQDAAMEKEQKTLIDRLNQIKTERDSFEKKITRFRSYKPDTGVCPICWIGDGLSANFKPIGGDGTTDNFKCSQCGYLLECET